MLQQAGALTAGVDLNTFPKQAVINDRDPCLACTLTSTLKLERRARAQVMQLVTISSAAPEVSHFAFTYNGNSIALVELKATALTIESMPF